MRALGVKPADLPAFLEPTKIAAAPSTIFQGADIFVWQYHQSQNFAPSSQKKH